jgi:WD40 repeat protein
MLRYVYAGDSRGGYCIWDIHSGKMILQNVQDAHSRNVRDIDWHPHQPLIATSRYFRMLL